VLIYQQYLEIYLRGFHLMNILVINAGSSSLKYQLIDMESKNVLAKGNCDRIGVDGNFKHTTYDGRGFDKKISLPNHNTAFNAIIEALLKGDSSVINNISEIKAVGHRIVNGGEKFINSVLVTEQVIKDFSEVINYAPLHNPAAMVGIKACREVFGTKVPNVLVFDTSFHQTMPPKAYIYPVAYKFYEEYKVRRYGAHGTSHRYVSLKLAEFLNKDIKDLKIVTCHIGNGSSISAVNGGKCVDTSMGFTPLAGIMMGTRCGTIDPSVVTFIMEKENLTPSEMEEELNKRSGLIGISGISSDCRDVEAAADKGNKRAKLAREIMTYEIKKHIGSYVAAMGGIDALVFTAGIGENSYKIREMVCENMEFLGIKIDKNLNDNLKHGIDNDISTPDAKVKTCVIPTNEEFMIAMDTKNIVDTL
jgi:acetate kinase